MPRYRNSAPRANRWMPLRYAAPCKVCDRTIPAGEHAFYDYNARTATCHDIACAQRDGLTEDTWHGSPTSGRWAPTIAAHRTGGGYVRDPGEDMADRWNESQR